MVPAELIPVGVILGVVATVGVIGNFIMVIVFFKFKKLRSPCHYLITINCLGDGLHNLGQFIFITHMFGQFKSSQFTCFLLNIPSLLGVISGACWMLALGIDRLIACKWPIKYRSLSGRAISYILCQCIGPLIYTAPYFYMSFSEINYTPVICSIPAAMGTNTFVVWSTSNLIVNGITIILYSATYCFVLKKDTGHGLNFRTIYKSIFLTVVFVVFGWTVTCIANTFIVKFISSSFGKLLVNLYAGIPVNIACASNIFIFHSINADYRSGIKQLFGFRSVQIAALYSDSRVTTTNLNQQQPVPE